MDPNTFETSDLILQKLGDIERVLTMRLEHALKGGKKKNEDIELITSLLAQVTKNVGEIKDLKLNLEGVETITLQGKPGENGKDCKPEDVAAILKESEDFIAKLKPEPAKPGEQGNPGPKGEDGKTPEKGKDYMTDKEVKQFKNELLSLVEAGLPVKVKRAVREVIESEAFTQKIQSLMKGKKTSVKDVEGLSEMIKAQIDKVYENVQEYTRKSGGGNPQISKMEDIDWKTLGDGLALKWNATRKIFEFGAVGGGSTVSSVNIVNVLETKTDNYTVAKTDFGKTLVMDSTSNKTFTLPATIAGDVGAKITFVKCNTGKVTLQMPASTFIADSNAAGTMFNDLTNETWATVTIQLISATKWVVVGGFGTWVTT